MLTIHSFLQNLFHFVKSLIINVTKKNYRNAAVIAAGAVVIAVVALNSAGFSGGGRSAGKAVEDNQEEDPEGTLEASEEIDATKAEIQGGLTEESWRHAQLFIGENLTKTVQLSLLEETAAIEDLEASVVMQGSEAEEVLEEIPEEIPEPQPVVPYTEEDYQVMLRIVEAEAGDCGVMGKILVANVIINRVKDSRFPNTITEVVYQRNKHTAQFSPVSNGMIDRVTVTEETVECVNRALMGEDHSQGALFFMMRSASTKKNVSWFDRELKWLFKDGPHEFFTYY